MNNFKDQRWSNRKELLARRQNQNNCANTQHNSQQFFERCLITNSYDNRTEPQWEINVTYLFSWACSRSRFSLLVHANQSTTTLTTHTPRLTYLACTSSRSDTCTGSCSDEHTPHSSGRTRTPLPWRCRSACRLCNTANRQSPSPTTRVRSGAIQYSRNLTCLSIARKLFAGRETDLEISRTPSPITNRRRASSSFTTFNISLTTLKRVLTDSSFWWCNKVRSSLWWLRSFHTLTDLQKTRWSTIPEHWRSRKYSVSLFGFR